MICIDVAAITETTEAVASEWVEASDLLRREVMEFLDGEVVGWYFEDNSSPVSICHHRHDAGPPRSQVMETEIEVLQAVRESIHQGRMFICVCVDEAAPGDTNASLRIRLKREVMEFLDGESTVCGWLDGAPYTMVNKFQLAIIDTLLARRGVRLPSFVYQP